MIDENAYVLKVLTGAQAGAEVSIADAEYVVGSGPDDDLHFVDVSLKPGHARLRLAGGVITIAGGAGTVKTQSGIHILAGDETWQEIDALDIITIGTTSFAIGPSVADWSRVQNFNAAGDAQKSATPPPVVTQPKWGAGRYIGIAAILALGTFGAVWMTGDAAQDTARAETIDNRPELEIILDAFGAFPFAGGITVAQEVDGVIEAAGYVDTPAERRALRNAIDETAIPVRFRVWSRAIIENEIQAIVDNQQIPVQFGIDSEGVLTLRGDILDRRRVDRLIATITENVAGVAAVDTQVQTAESYLEEIRALLVRTELDESVIVRLDGMLIEANGVVIADKIDNWVGFIQSYARRYADKVALRSFVQLVDENGEIIADPVSAQPGLPVILGSADALESEPTAASDPEAPALPGSNQSGVVLDLDRLREGSFGAEDVFAGFNSSGLTSPTNFTPANVVQPNFGPDLQQTNVAVQPSVIDAQYLNRAARPESIRGTRVLYNMTKALLSNETGVAAPHGYVDDLAALGDVDVTLEELKRLWTPTLGGQAAQDAYLNMLVNDPAADFTECWDNSIAAFGNLPYTLFWLDYLSISDDVDVSVINLDAQVLLLEAALNPNRLAACAARLSAAQDIDLASLSLYLQETDINPEFIRFIARQLDPYPFALSGVNTGFQNRYAQLANGARLNEGAAPDPSSLLVNIGELGVLVKEQDRLLVTVYDASLNWKSGG
ncbi:FHA domain-containing protein [Yoonia sp. BS5-3]|uniref:FHA domain-containing protein n=1 Tax=Yoonia phaeophyticola TaxID=3137369 RepID=A0ABZ2V4U4_9RHOB